MSENATILYVDDEELNLTLFQLNFKKRFNVLLAESGLEGLEMLKRNNNIVVVISDMKMPGMNGIEFIKLARKEFPKIRFFLLTGYEINEEIADALNDRLIHKYFRKPFNKSEIEEAILEFL
ncbi:MAG: response regulator [Bacteroidales bacterium]|jgi:two-component system response regulator (stage 0 sporulation protein F)|nr:response regulator [Bacteroidales bacterium]